MDRRKALLAFAAVACVPLGALAQPTDRVWRLGYLSTSNDPERLDILRRAMRDLGYVEGRNLVIVARFANSNPARLPPLAAELLEAKADVIVASGTPAVVAAKKASTTVPIVTPGAGDPVGSGLVASLAHPGGNVTGVSNFSGDLAPKLVEMLKAAVPKLSRMAILLNPSNPAFHATLNNGRGAARKFGIEAIAIEATSSEALENAFQRMSRQSVGALMVQPDSLFITQRKRVAALAAQHRLASIMTLQSYAEAGGFMSYGHDLADNFRLSATYVDRIFKGAKPADLPMQQPDVFQLVVNLRTAKAIGLEVPKLVRERADRLIE
jgi:putative ABC transport system substrate-binding protein